MNINEMLTALSPKRESLNMGGFDFYARPMNFQEYAETISNPNEKNRHEYLILKCIENEDGTPVFENIEQIRGLYTNIRTNLINMISEASFMPDPVEVEKKSEATPS